MRILLFTILWALFAASSNAQTVVVLTPSDFRPALAKWKKHREAQGYKVTVRAPDGDVKGFDYVLILGDVKQVPCAYRDGESIKGYERDPRIASDNQRADTDGDGLPDLCIGRLPADDVDEAEALLDKVIAYEKNEDFSAWRRRLNVVAGVGGFGQAQDAALEYVATTFLTRSVPGGYDLHVTYCNPNSSFCPPPSTVAETATERFNEGALIVTYLGHGSRSRLDSMRFQDKRYRIFDEDHVDDLEARHGAPIAVLIACSTGHIDGSPDCLAELMLKRPKGPVAIIAASRVSMPYANGIFAKEMLEAIFSGESPTIGKVVWQAKRRLVVPREGDLGRKEIEGLANLFMPAKKREREREDHVYLYNLLGDPTMRIPLPAAATIAGVVEDGKVVVTGTSPVDGKAIVELAEPRTPMRPRRTGDTAADFQKTYERANRWAVASVSVDVKDGKFSAQLPATKGSYTLRVYVAGAESASIGSVEIKIP